MRFNTGNPVEPDGSSDPRDLYDTAGIVDLLVTGEEDSTKDRLGRDRKTWKGIENDFQQAQTQRGEEFALSQSAREAEFVEAQNDKNDRFQQLMDNSQYEPMGNYAAGINITSRNQIIWKDGEYYRIAASASIPYTTTGDWATDSPKFVSVGDAALRQDLAGVDGSSKVTYRGPGGVARSVKSKLDDQIGPLDFALGLGPTDNYTAAFSAFEALYQGLLVDLSGRTFIVDAVPSKNGYKNGFFKVAGFTKPALISNSFAAQPHHSHLFGGQLAALFQGLSNPLEQMTGIVFLGDSQIWGSGNGTEQATTNPRDGTLSDARDYFGTSSFVNIIKRYIGKTFARDAAPALSNHPTAPTGQSIATYTTTNVLFPSDGDFTLVQAAGANISTAVLATPVPVTYAQRTMTNANVAVETGHTLSFNFTGTSFKLGFGCTEATATYYELVVGGISQGLFSTHAGVDGFIDISNNNYRTHTFGYVRNALVEIKTRRNGEAGTRILRLESITIDKVIRITNNGINGASSISYRASNLVGTPADGLAVLPDDNHVLIKIGTNDRISATSRPKGSNAFKANYGLFIDAVKAISPTANIVLCCSNPAAEDPATYSFTMQEVRNVTYQTAKARSIDMVDGYAVFKGLTLVPGFSADGLHLNQAGYELEARNFINSLEASSSSSLIELVGRVNVLEGRSDALEGRPRGVGDGQTWQDVKTSRAIGGTYTNSTGRPIQVMASAQGPTGGGFLTLTVSGVVVDQEQYYANTASASVRGTIPAGGTYGVASTGGGTLLIWSELRA